ncbi:putative exodeoxyribonuclease [Salmonella phage SSBI34]|nr:putative exodeoxyribonuclease [Salmonella phage SSBI34]
MGYPVVKDLKSIVTDDVVVALDLDQTCYVAAAGAEKRTIIARHKKSGAEKEFKNKTEFWGRQKNVVGGWLKDQNINREAQCLASGRKFVPWTRDDFEILDKQTPEPVENCLHLLKIKINAILEHLDCPNGHGVLGGSGNFRLALPTPEIYKGNREDSIRPLLLQETRDYVVRKYGAVVIDGIEADDYLSILGYKGYLNYKKTGKFSHIVASFDKDQVQVPSLLFNSMRDSNERTWKHPECWLIDESMGEIWMDNNKVKGWGQLFFGYQMLFGDSADNVKPYQNFDIKFGEVSAFKLLAGCKTEKEMWTTIINQYKMWFPDGVHFTDHMGIDRKFTAGQWASVIFQSVYMKREYNDPTTLSSVLKRVGAI